MINIKNLKLREQENLNFQKLKEIFIVREAKNVKIICVKFAASLLRTIGNLEVTLATNTQARVRVINKRGKSDLKEQSKEKHSRLLNNNS